MLADVQIDCHTREGIGLLTTVAELTDEVVGHIEEGIFATSVTSSDSLRSFRVMGIPVVAKKALR